MLTDSNIIYIFKILLNKDISVNELHKYKNNDLHSLKQNIYKSKEFKDFRDLHLENIRSIVEEEIGKLYTGLNFEKYWKELIRLQYDTKKFRQYIRDIVNNIKKDNNKIYNKYFSIDKEIPPSEIADIMRTNCSTEFYISTSDFFMEKCDVVIENLLKQL